MARHIQRLDGLAGQQGSTSRLLMSPTAMSAAS
jgi:hypothetical protein